MKIVKIERLENSKFEVTVRHNWFGWLFGFAREEKRVIRDTGMNFSDGSGSIYVDAHGNMMGPWEDIVISVDNWRKAESLKHGL